MVYFWYIFVFFGRDPLAIITRLGGCYSRVKLFIVLFGPIMANYYLFLKYSGPQRIRAGRFVLCRVMYSYSFFALNTRMSLVNSI
jgi:hypothetical protein